MIDYDICGTLEFHSIEHINLLDSLQQNIPKYLWWNTYLVKMRLDQDTLKKIPENFSIIDNLDNDGEWYLLKDIFCKNCIVIYEMSESSNMYIKKYDEQVYIFSNLKLLSNICEIVYPCMGIYPGMSVCAFKLINDI